MYTRVETSPFPVPRGAAVDPVAPAVPFDVQQAVFAVTELLAALRLSPWFPPLAGAAAALVALLVVLHIRRRGAGWLRRSGGPVGTSIKQCRWRLDRRGRTPRLRRWRCTTCGVEAFSADRRPPKECKRHLREAPL